MSEHRSDEQYEGMVLQPGAIERTPEQAENLAHELGVAVVAQEAEGSTNLQPTEAADPTTQPPKFRFAGGMVEHVVKAVTQEGAGALSPKDARNTGVARQGANFRSFAAKRQTGSSSTETDLESNKE